MKLKISVILIAMAFVIYFFWSKGTMVQEQSYHLFADTRTFLGVPNTMDVLTNLCFVIVGCLGILKLTSTKSWFWFFFNVFLIGPGSAYYHWAPNDFTLIWDRLPMSMGFMAMYVALLSEHIDTKFEKVLPMSLLLGMTSVLVWVVTSDLRFYFIVQFSSFITVPLILVLFRSQYSHKMYYFLALGLYALAKVTEVKDREIFEMTNRIVSGHSIKHVLAALGLLALWWMVRSRKELIRSTSA